MMRKMVLIIVIGLITGLGGCSKKQAGPVSPAEILGELQLPGLNRGSAIQTYVGDSLYEYIDGGAELYHQYNFVDVSTVELKYNEIEIIVDIYRFDNSVNAFGLFSVQRPPYNPADSSTLTYGIESYTSPTSIDFVKGIYVAKLVGFDDVPETMSALKMVAGQLVRLIPGTDQKPEAFALFPEQNAITQSEKYYAANFLEYAFLNDFYTRDYRIDGDTVTLFLTNDASGEKFDQWIKQVNLTEAGMKMLKDLLYKPGRSFISDDSYYGLIVAGSIDSELAGILNFKETQKLFLDDWLKSLQNKQ